MVQKTERLIFRQRHQPNREFRQFDIEVLGTPLGFDFGLGFVERRWGPRR